MIRPLKELSEVGRGTAPSPFQGFGRSFHLTKRKRR
jgi:hypothetical protein